MIWEFPRIGINMGILHNMERHDLPVTGQPATAIKVAIGSLLRNHGVFFIPSNQYPPVN